MSDIALGFNHIWGKFKRAEKYHSPRDLMLAMTKGPFLGNYREVGAGFKRDLTGILTILQPNYNRYLEHELRTYGYRKNAR